MGHPSVLTCILLGFVAPDFSLFLKGDMAPEFYENDILFQLQHIRTERY